MLIAFGGRMRSGKGELANICAKYGYKKLYFALPLKELCADILDISIEALNDAKNQNIDIGLTIGEDICSIIHDETDIPLDFIREKCLGKELNNVRDMVQFIGTDLIRSYDPDWHVKRLKEMIHDGEDYVFEDLRFPNEKRMIEELGGDCWFVVRPTIDNVSNHISETSLKWHDCYNKIIINDSTLPYLLFKWDGFMDNYQKSCEIREKMFKETLDKGIKFLEKNSLLEMMFINKAMFTYVPKDYEKEDIKKITMNKDNSIFLTLNDDTLEYIDNPLIIEDLKIFL